MQIPGCWLQNLGGAGECHWKQSPQVSTAGSSRKGLKDPCPAHRAGPSSAEVIDLKTESFAFHFYLGFLFFREM